MSSGAGGTGISQAMLSELTAKQRKALFVRIGIQGEPASVRQIPRFRLNAANINRVFNCDVEFLQEDATGNIIWPKNWASDCLPPPYLYFIREKVWPELDPDAMEQVNYRGRSLVVVDNVPEEVTKGILVAWMNAGLDDDDPDLASNKMQLQETQENLAKVEKQIRELPSMKVQGSNAKEELEMKKKRAQTLNMQKTDLEENIRELQEVFDKLRRDREAMIDTAFQVKLAETKEPMRLNVWEARFSKDKKGQRMAYIAVHKFNWSEFRVAYHRYNNRIITGKNDLTDLTGEFQEINMRNVTLSRRKHGVGMYKFSDERGFYSGNFRHGLRHGMGTEINQQGRFQGNFDRDWRKGPGSIVYSNGDAYRGPYAGSRYHMRESLIFGDEYHDGLPHGKGKIRFVDGSVYDGEWKDGSPSGKGKYVSSLGIVMEGVFGRWATLHGYGSYTVDDVTRIGIWREGLLHGHGVEIDMQSGSYEGAWKHGEKHGYGVLLSSLVGGKYEGWYHQGYRWGRGILNYGNIDKDKEAEEAKMRKIAESMRAKSLAVGINTEIDENGDEVIWDEAATGVGVVAAASSLFTGKKQSSTTRSGRSMTALSDTTTRSNAANSASNSNTKNAIGAGAGVAGGSSGGLGAAAGVGAAKNALALTDSKSNAGSYADEEKDEDEQKAEELAYGTDAEIIGQSGAAARKVGDDGKVKSEYETMQGEPVHFIPFRGDYCYEGRWRAGGVRTNGVFTKRFGRPEPNLHVLKFVHNGKNPDLPLLVDLDRLEEELARKRAQFAKVNVKDTIDKRLIKEAENLSSFVYWKHAAAKNQREVRRRTRRGKKQLEEIKAAIKKPERLAGAGEEDDAQEDYSDDSMEAEEDEEEGDDKVADNDEQQFMV